MHNRPSVRYVDQATRYGTAWLVAMLAVAAADTGLAEDPTEPPQPAWKAGVARASITPDQSMWMAGYASRRMPSEGNIHDLPCGRTPSRWTSAMLTTSGKRRSSVTVSIRPKEGWRPKSGDERVVPMSDRLFELLQARSRGGRWVFTARVTPRHPQPGRQISARRLLQYLKRILKRLGLTGHLHTFRHSFISFAAYEGVSERVLRKWIGHVDRDILDWYFHLADRQSQEAMRQLSEAAQRKKATKSTEKRTDSNSAQSQHKPRRDENGKSAK